MCSIIWYDLYYVPASREGDSLQGFKYNIINFVIHRGGLSESGRLIDSGNRTYDLFTQVNHSLKRLATHGITITHHWHRKNSFYYFEREFSPVAPANDGVADPGAFSIGLFVGKAVVNGPVVGRFNPRNFILIP